MTLSEFRDALATRAEGHWLVADRLKTKALNDMDAYEDHLRARARAAEIEAVIEYIDAILAEETRYNVWVDHVEFRGLTEEQVEALGIDPEDVKDQ